MVVPQLGTYLVDLSAEVNVFGMTSLAKKRVKIACRRKITDMLITRLRMIWILHIACVKYTTLKLFLMASPVNNEI